MARTYQEFLAAQGIKIASAAPTPTKTAAPAKVAEMTDDEAKRLAAEAAAKAEKAEEKKEEKKEDKKESALKTAEAKYAAFMKTAQRTNAQAWLAERGVFVEDTKVATYLVLEEVKKAELEKRAHIEKLAAEEQARGAIFYQGMVKESTAMRVALGQADESEVMKVAALLSLNPIEIIKRAEEMAAASSSPALIGNELGRAARDDSAVMRAAGEGTMTRPVTGVDGAEQTQGSGSNDPNLTRMVDVWSMPNNPGLSHGQRTGG